MNKVTIWNRASEKAIALVYMLGGRFEGVSFDSNMCLDNVVRVGDIESCAMNSEVPLYFIGDGEGITNRSSSICTWLYI